MPISSEGKYVAGFSKPLFFINLDDLNKAKGGNANAKSPYRVPASPRTSSGSRSSVRKELG